MTIFLKCYNQSIYLNSLDLVQMIKGIKTNGGINVSRKGKIH